MKEVYQVRHTSQFKKDLKRLIKQGKDISKLQEVVDTLGEGKPLDARYVDHALSGSWRGFRDCHIEPDWILLYKLEKKILVLTLTRSGSHAELEL
jgi:mRNA interferase YafQ